MSKAVVLRNVPLNCARLLILWMLLAPLCVWTSEEPQPPQPPPAVAPAADQDPATVAALADELLSQIHAQNLDTIWDAVNRLVRLGAEHSNSDLICGKLEEHLSSGKSKVQLACAFALCQLNHSEKAGPALFALLHKSGDVQLRRLAANALGLAFCLHPDQQAATELCQALKSEKDELTRVAVARALLRASPCNEGRDELLRLATQAVDKRAGGERPTA